MREATVPQWIAVTADGRQAALLLIYQQPGGNTVEIMRQVRSKLAAFREKLPAGVHIADWYDQSASCRSPWAVISPTAKSARASCRPWTRGDS